MLGRLPGPFRARYERELEGLPAKSEGPWTGAPPKKPMEEEGMLVRILYGIVCKKMHFVGGSRANMHGINMQDAKVGGLDAYLREVGRYHTSPEDYREMAKVPALMVDPENEPVAVTPKPDGSSEHHAHTLAPYMPEGSLVVQGTAEHGCDDHCFGGARLAFGEKVTAEMLPMLKKRLGSSNLW